MDTTIPTQFDTKNLNAISRYLHCQRVGPERDLSHWQKDYDAAMLVELNFTTKFQYDLWKHLWVTQYLEMTKDARTGFKWLRSQRNAMMHIRTEAKKKSWEMKLARLAVSQ